jgi:Family of unknown function (DUF5706)
LAGDDPQAQHTEASLAYIRNLYSHVMEWYKSADTKSQILLTLDGIFIAAFTGLVLRRPDELSAITANLSLPAWFFISIMIVTLLLSVYFAIICIRARLINKGEARRLVNRNAGSTPPSKIMWFFQLVAEHEPEQFVAAVLNADARFETESMSYNLPLFARNVVAKHEAVNRGFTCAGVALVCLLLAGTVYAFGTLSAATWSVRWLGSPNSTASPLPSSAGPPKGGCRRSSE